MKSCSLHEFSEDFFLVDLVANVVNVNRELVLGVVMDDVTNVTENDFLEYATF